MERRRGERKEGSKDRGGKRQRTREAFASFLPSLFLQTFPYPSLAFLFQPLLPFTYPSKPSPSFLPSSYKLSLPVHLSSSLSNPSLPHSSIFLQTCPASSSSSFRKLSYPSPTLLKPFLPLASLSFPRTLVTSPRTLPRGRST